MCAGVGVGVGVAVGLGLALAACTSITTAGPTPAAPTRPHVLFLLADDLQWNALGFLGDDRIRTPNLDRLAARGTTFTQVYNQGSVHGAVCAPSRAMMLTGRHLWRRGGDACLDQPVWGETFGAAGYATFVTGKWHNGPEALARAFEEVGPTGPGMFHSTPRGGDAYDRGGDGGAWRPDDEAREGHWRPRGDEVVHSSELWADEALGFLRRRRAAADGHARDPDALAPDAHAPDAHAPDTRPFFAHIAFHAPHDPRQAPAEFVAAYPPASMALPPNVLPEHPFDQGALRIRDELLAPFPRTDDAIRLHMAEYAAIVAHLDREVGRILDELDALGFADDTLVLFTGDHGLAVGQHGLLGKQNLYDHSTRVALILAGPGVPEATRRHALVYLHALFATTGELAGVDVPETLDAPSLVPLLTNSSAGLHDTIFAAYAQTQRMVRDGRHKLIVYPQARQVQLFDLERDPFETTNLAADPTLAPTLRRLAAALPDWMAATGDPLPPEDVAAPWTWTVTEVVPVGP